MDTLKIKYSEVKVRKGNHSNQFVTKSFKNKKAYSRKDKHKKAW